jgi:tetratricopeptide (TPR) repeat protein
MAKKTKSLKQKKQVLTNTSPVDKQFDLIEEQIVQQRYAEAVVTCERLLSYLPQHARQRAAVWAHLGTAQAMLQHFPQSYEAFSQALALEPQNADHWYNRSIASCYTMRFGQALRDAERAIELNTSSELTEKLADALQLCRQQAEESMRLRGPAFTLDQLIQQEHLFQQGLEWMEAGKHEEARQAFQSSIDMGDCLPQPWGNLGVCLLMQERYDEAEGALKRALEIDPDYTIAKNNLSALRISRRTGPPARVELTEPFKHSKLNQSITFLKEK